MENISTDINKNQSGDFWQAEVLGRIYETNFEEMTQWITDGALMPTDKVRRGNLRWLEAGKIPPLMPFFNAKAQGIEPPQIQTNITDAGIPPNENVAETEKFQPVNNQTNSENYFHNQPQSVQFFETNFPVVQPANENFCALHPESEAIFHCETCANAFCPLCVKSYGGTVKICPMCGAMCRKIGETDVKKEREIKYQQAIGEGFGVNDIGRAFAHPFKFKASLIFGAIMFMLFTIGQNAGGFGGISMIFAALVCFMLANMLAFGIMANTIDNFSQGKLEKNFMPDFDDFNLWDDVVHPFFLTIGIYISSLGPLFLVVAVGIFVMVKATQSNLELSRTQPDQTVNSPFLIDEQKAVNQSEEVKKLLEGVKEDATEKRAITENGLDEFQTDTAENEEEEFAKLNEMIQQNRKAELESVVGKTPETKQKEYDEIYSNLKEQGLVVLLLGFVALLWAVFYMPAACAVAGYTRSFSAALNPAYGVDFIKRTGVDYLKILGVYIVLLFGGMIFSAILQIILFPFYLPGMGNIPATAIASFYTFYVTIVLACLLGYAVYKNSDKLGLYRG